MSIRLRNYRLFRTNTALVVAGIEHQLRRQVQPPVDAGCRGELRLSYPIPVIAAIAAEKRMIGTQTLFGTGLRRAR